MDNNLGVPGEAGPTGAGGTIMSRRSSNVARSRWAVQLPDVQRNDRVIEFGCGPGVALLARPGLHRRRVSGT